jgi:hypothetical protein
MAKSIVSSLNRSELYRTFFRSKSLLFQQLWLFSLEAASRFGSAFSFISADYPH